MPRISLFCSIASSCRWVLTGYSTAYPPRRVRNRVHTHLQAGLEDFDEAADLVGDLGARRAELGRAGDLRTNAPQAVLDTRVRPDGQPSVPLEYPQRTLEYP